MLDWSWTREVQIEVSLRLHHAYIGPACWPRHSVIAHSFRQLGASPDGWPADRTSSGQPEPCFRGRVQHVQVGPQILRNPPP